MTPDGKPTPGLLTKTALESASIPHLTINAGSKIPPNYLLLNPDYLLEKIFQLKMQ